MRRVYKLHRRTIVPRCNDDSITRHTPTPGLHRIGIALVPLPLVFVNLAIARVEQAAMAHTKAVYLVPLAATRSLYVPKFSTRISRSTTSTLSSLLKSQAGS